MVAPLTLTGEAATEALAQDIAMVAGPGWTILLEGDLGAGKTTFARAFIRALAKDSQLEVPSPTYTLVQRYDEAEPPVLHADLYRLADPSEMVELGLDDADDPAIRLVEWPGNAGEGAFPDALTLTLSMAEDSDARIADIEGPDDQCNAIARSLQVRAFLRSCEQGDAARQRLMGDASTRRYERLANAPMILMDAPRRPDGPLVNPDIGGQPRSAKPYSQLVHLAESVHAFAAVGTALRKRGFAAPAIHGAALDDGLLLIEDMGNGSILHADGSPNAERYIATAALLADMHKTAWHSDLPIPGGGTHSLQRYDADVFLTEITLLPDWYVAHRAVDVASFDRAGFMAAWRALLAPLEAEAPTLTLRDYHSPNIIWREGEEGAARIGLIDHQDALLGPPAYDLASLVYDARVTIEPDLQESMISAYLQASSAEEAHVRARLAIMAGQRNSKILGIFARLNDRDGKPGYLRHLPRVEQYMRTALRHDALAPLRPYYDQLLPKGEA